MTAPSLEATNNGGYKLKGTVTLGTVPSLLDKLDVPADSQIELDLSETTGSDSSLVALLLAWTRRAGRPLVCKNVPDEVTSLIDLYGVRELLL